MDLSQYFQLLIQVIYSLDNLIDGLNLTFFGVHVTLELIVGVTFFAYLIDCILNNDSINDIENDDYYY